MVVEAVLHDDRRPGKPREKDQPQVPQHAPPASPESVPPATVPTILPLPIDPLPKR